MISNRSLTFFIAFLTTTPLSAQKPVASRSSEASVGNHATLSLQGKLVDLTHSFDQSTIYWPTAERFRLEVEKFGITDKGYFYASNRYAASEHGGTHLDAPIHFSKKGEFVDAVPLNRFVGEAAVIDVTSACSKDRDYLVGVSDLRKWEVQNHRQLVDVIVLIHTGFGDHWSDPTRYLGTDQVGPDAVSDLHFPGLDPDAAQWLADHRSVKAVGIDTASIDRGQSQKFQSHVRLFTNQIPAFENVANLDRLPSQGATVVALPMKIANGSGAPLRIIAAVPE